MGISPHGCWQRCCGWRRKPELSIILGRLAAGDLLSCAAGAPKAGTAMLQTAQDKDGKKEIHDQHIVRRGEHDAADLEIAKRRKARRMIPLRSRLEALERQGAPYTSASRLSRVTSASLRVAGKRFGRTPPARTPTATITSGTKRLTTARSTASRRFLPSPLRTTGMTATVTLMVRLMGPRHRSCRARRAQALWTTRSRTGC